MLCLRSGLGTKNIWLGNDHILPQNTFSPSQTCLEALSVIQNVCCSRQKHGRKFPRCLIQNICFSRHKRGGKVYQLVIQNIHFSCHKHGYKMLVGWSCLGQWSLAWQPFRHRRSLHCLKRKSVLIHVIWTWYNTRMVDVRHMRNTKLTYIHGLHKRTTFHSGN